MHVFEGFTTEEHGRLFQLAELWIDSSAEEDESMFRVTLENLGRSRSAEKHVRIGLATEDSEGAKPSVSFRRLATTCHLSSVFTTVG